MKKHQYPTQTGAYAVKVKSGQSHDSWHAFDVARLQISVGQEYHEGDKMSATWQWLKPRFSTVQVCVNDSLQRFNMMFEQSIDLDCALKKSREAGSSWLDRHKEMIEQLDNVEVYHWDHWLKHHSYDSVRQKINNLYQEHNEFKTLIDNNTQDIWARRKIKDENKYRDERYREFFDLSKEYLLEEISVFSIMFEERSAIDIYPGTVLFAATVLQGRTLPQAPCGLGKGHFCRIDFSKKYQPANSDNPFPSQHKLTP